VPMVLLARTLPVTRAERRAQGVAVSAAAAAAARPTSGALPATAPGSATPHP
jgi:hypothetical protein